MTRQTIETAVREGIPFAINMADGKTYEREPHKIALGAARVVVLDDRDLPHILTMLTMTGISYLPRGTVPPEADQRIPIADPRQ